MELPEGLYIDWKMIAVIIVIVVTASLLSRFIRWSIARFYKSASESLNLDPTTYKFFKNAASLFVWLGAFIAIISMIPALKAIAVTLFAGAGILVAILGFAAQEAFANIVGGVFVVLFKPFRIHDMIKVGNLDYGIVEDITLRHTIIKNFENKRIVIPNAVINNETIINDSIEDTNVCRYVEVGISYDSSIDLATKIIQEEAEKHPKTIDVRTHEQKENGLPTVEVRVMNFGDSSIDLRGYVWTDDPFNAIRMHSDINKAIKERFDKEGVEIPFPYRTVVYKKDLPPNAQ